MDIELARTFLEIVTTGSFVRAAERLNVGQTTVSARIKLLEQQLGRPLFVRNKSGASLTPAGEQFLRYAPSFVQMWQRARLQVAVPPGHRAALTIGSEVTLWQPLLLDWVLWLRESLRDIALRVHVDVPQDLISLVAGGLVDAAIMYAPQHRPGLNIDRLMEEKLVLVTSNSDEHSPDTDYVHVDWGPDFELHHGEDFSEASSGLFVNLGPLGLSYVLAKGGAGYFRMRTVQPYLTAGKLRLVPGAPQYSYPIYVVYSDNAEDSVMQPALTGLRQIAAERTTSRQVRQQQQ
jgi:DNA-binding transcriptional LysR family regulator